MYDYFTETKGLDNLIWVWSSTDGLGDISKWCPEKVDVVGADIYNDKIGEMNSAFAGIDKPVALTEFGSFANAQYLVDNGKESAWCLFWNEINYDNDSNKIAAKAFYADEKVVNLEDLPYEIRTVCLAEAPAEGSAMNPKKISNQADLEALATAVNGGADQEGVYYELTNDITLTGTWTSIGKYTGAGSIGFSGVFDGKENTISGLTLSDNSSTASYIGLFGYVDKDGVIKNLSVEGQATITSKTAGGIVGALRGTISNCIFEGALSSSASGKNLGGIVGSMVSLDGSLSLVTNCISNGTISRSNSVRMGGIVGENSCGTISYCVNNASLNCSFLNGQLGGIVGYVNNAGLAEHLWVKQCVNRGNITVGTNISTYADANAGGIVGYLQNGNISGCYNIGAITGFRPAGIVSNAANGTSVSDCYNAGTLTGTRVGAISKFGTGTFSNCYYMDSIENAYYYTDSDKGALTGATAVSADYMKTTEFVTALNAGSDVWTANSAENNGYPVFKATSKYVLDVLGSTIRYETPTGIRFASTVKKTDALAELIGRGEYAYSAEDSVYFGTLVITKAALGDAELTVNTAKDESRIFNGSTFLLE